MSQTTHALLPGTTFQPMSFFKFLAFMTAGFNEAAKQQGADAALELDEIKQMHMVLRFDRPCVSVSHVAEVSVFDQHGAKIDTRITFSSALRCSRLRMYLIGGKRNDWCFDSICIWRSSFLTWLIILILIDEAKCLFSE